jgi:hypothetical protein
MPLLTQPHGAGFNPLAFVHQTGHLLDDGVVLACVVATRTGVHQVMCGGADVRPPVVHDVHRDEDGGDGVGPPEAEADPDDSDDGGDTTSGAG